MAQKRLRVTVAGKVYEVLVDVVDEDTSHGTGAGQSVPAAGTVQSSVARVDLPPISSLNAAPLAHEGASPETGVILSPLAGSLVAVRCGLGDTLAPDSPVAVVEAMKMETIIYAGCIGRVQQIYAKTGDTLTEGQPLIKVQ